MDWTALLQNPLMLQYLSGAGSAISQGQPLAEGIDPITQDVIGAQSQHKTQMKYLEMLKKMLGGELVPGSSMKMNDKGIMSINVPPQQTLATEGSAMPGGSGTDWTDPAQQAKLSPMLRAFNPFR